MRSERICRVAGVIAAFALDLAVRWLFVFELDPAPFQHTYDFSGRLVDVALVGTVASVLTGLAPCFTGSVGRRLTLFAHGLCYCAAVAAFVKAFVCILAIPSVNDGPGMVAAFAAMGIGSALLPSCMKWIRRGSMWSDATNSLLESARSGDSEAGPGDSAENWGNVKRLVQLVMESRKWLYFGLVTLFVRMPFSIAIPHFVAEGIAACTSGGHVINSVVAILVCGFFDSVLDFWNFFFFVIVEKKTVRNVKNRLFAALLRQEMAFFDAASSGDIMSRLTADTVQMSNGLSFVFRFTVESIVRTVSIAGYMFVCSPRLAFLTCSMIPFNAFLNLFYSNWLQDNAKAMLSALAESNATAMQALTGILTVKSFANEAVEEGNYRSVLRQYYELGILQGILQSGYYMVVATFLMNCIVQAAVLGYGGYLVFHAIIPAQTLIAFMLYRSQLQDQVSGLLNNYTSLIQGAASADRVFALMDRTPRLQQPIHSSSHDFNPAGHVKFTNVYFTYAVRPDTPVLQGLDLEVFPRQCIAVVGSSASGKTTLFRLLLHFYEVSTGAVLLDGVDVRDLDRRVLCKCLSIVNQEPTLFRGTIEENICYSTASAPEPPPSRGCDWRKWNDLWRSRFEDSRPEATPTSALGSGAAREAAVMANAHEFISRLPQGYATEVGERGVQLSGGQRQRVAIARSICSRPKVLLLDEATSALDNESEKLVQEALDTARQERTTIMIAHRLSTVVSADAIVVIDHGQVAERGTHMELMETRGIYHRLWQRQIVEENAC